jgi:hypothetical protein
MRFPRAFALIAVLGISLFAVGCSGHSGSATPPVLLGGAPTGASADVTPGTSRTTMSTTSATVLVGQVDYMTYFSSTHEFQIETTSGSHYWIYAPSAAWTYNGLTLKVGVWVTASGSLSFTTLTASSISLSSSQPATSSTTSPTVIGQIDYTTYYSTEHEFQVKTASGAYYWIYAPSTTQWTYNGLTVKDGVWASATGSWKSSTTLTASSITLTSTEPTSTSTATPAPTSGVPKHVQTAEYLYSSTETGTSPSTYAPYLSWAYTLYSKMGLTQAAGIKTVLYASPIMPNSNTYEYNTLNGSYPSVRAQTCTGTIVKTYNGSGLLSDPTKSSATSYFQNIVSHYESLAKTANSGYTQPWNLIFIDNDGPLYGASVTPCNYSPTTWGTYQDNALATTGQKFILNSLSVAEYNVSTYVQRLSGSAIAGGEFEECFMTSLWASEEDSQLQTIAKLKSEGKPGGAGFWCYADNTSASASTSIPQRMYIYASFLLTYDPNYSVFQESFTTPSTFKVMPETGFVPMNPVSVPTSSTGLATSTGAYMQRYSNCYYRGSSLGECEIIVNPSTTSSVSVPNPWGLHHSMVLSGAGVLDGGTVSFTGSVPSSIGPKSGLILTP